LREKEGRKEKKEGGDKSLSSVPHSCFDLGVSHESERKRPVFQPYRTLREKGGKKKKRKRRERKKGQVPGRQLSF